MPSAPPSSSAPCLPARPQTPPAAPQAPAALNSTVPPPRKGRLKQGVTNGVFGRNARDAAVFEENCREAARLGIAGYDLVAPDRWPILKKYGLTCSMYPGGPGGTIAVGLSNKEKHADLHPEDARGDRRVRGQRRAEYHTSSAAKSKRHRRRRGSRELRHLPQRGQGARRGQGRHASASEYLNSKVNHKDYMFDHIAWGVDVMKRVNSPRVKILYDIYHAQIMDGDIVRNIRDHYQWIAHFHTGGNPGGRRSTTRRS